MGQLVECDSRDPVMSNSCLFLLHGACYGLPFFVEGAEAEASLSSFHKIFQLPQTRWTQRLFTIHCLKIWARFPSCILLYPPTHTNARAEQHTQRAARTDKLKKTSLNINPWQHIYTHTYCCCFNTHKVGLVWRDGLPGTHAPPSHTHFDQCSEDLWSEGSGSAKGANPNPHTPSAPPKTQCSAAKAGTWTL